MAQIRLPQQIITKTQSNWLKKQKKKSGESFASIVRKLIQEKIDNEKNN